MAVSAAASGMDVQLICPWKVSSDVRQGVRLRPFTRFPRGRNRLFAVRREVRGILAGMDAPPDIVHFHDPDLLPLASRRPTESAYIYDVHENFHEEVKERDWLPRFMRSPLSVVADRIERRWASRCDGIVCVVPPQLPRFEVTGARLEMVRNFASNSVFACPTPFRHDRRPKVIGTTAAHYESNGSLVFLEAARIVADSRPDFRFEVGDRFASSTFRSRFLETRTRLGLEETVRIVPNVPAERMPERLARWFIGVSSNLDDRKQRLALPTKVFEYMAAGLPTVASRLPLIESLVQDGRDCLLVDPGDPDELAGAIIGLIDDPRRAEALSAAGRRAFEQRLNWESEIDRLANFYQAILDSTANRRSRVPSDLD